MSRKTNQIWQRVSFAMLLSGFFMLSSILSAQQSISSQVKDFSWQEFYDPPHQNQMKSQITGAEAQPQTNGTILIKELKLEMYRENGEREILVLAPECVYDSAQRVAYSAGRLQVQTGNGQFSIEGVGFLWRQTNSSLIISNDAHMIIRQQVQKTEPSKP
jgi:hypothetical protein